MSLRFLQKRTYGSQADGRGMEEEIRHILRNAFDCPRHQRPLCADAREPGTDGCRMAGSAAEAAAGLAAKRQRDGRPVDIRDTQIAGIVIARRAKLATRNVKHFAALTAGVVDPWAANR